MKHLASQSRLSRVSCQKFPQFLRVSSRHPYSLLFKKKWQIVLPSPRKHKYFYSVNPFGSQNLAIGIVVNKGHDYSSPSSYTLLPVAVFKYQQFSICIHFWLTWYFVFYLHTHRKQWQLLLRARL
jgi:hypothetical protein